MLTSARSPHPARGRSHSNRDLWSTLVHAQPRVVTHLQVDYRSCQCQARYLRCRLPASLWAHCWHSTMHSGWLYNAPCTSCASTWANQSSGSAGQKGGSWRLTVEMSPVVGGVPDPTRAWTSERSEGSRSSEVVSLSSIAVVLSCVVVTNVARLTTNSSKINSN